MTPAVAPQRSDTWLFVTLVAVTVVTAIVSSLGAPLVPSIATAYDVSLSTAQWVLTSTLLTAVVATPALVRWGSGRLRRPVVVGALGVVLAGTVLSALPTGITGLLIGRSLQGIGLAVTPLALAVARDAWSDERLASRLSLLSVATVAGAGAGYPLTGVLADWVGVAGAYAAGSVLVAVALVLAWRHLPVDADGVPHQVDLMSVALVGLGLLGVLLAISEGNAWGWVSWPSLVLTASGLLLLTGWIRRTQALARRGGQVLIDLRLAARPGVLAPNIVTLAIAAGTYTLLTLSVLVVRADGSEGWGLGLSAGAAGLVLLPYAVLSVFGSRVAIAVSRHFGPHLLLPFGSTLFASSLLLAGVAHDRLWQVLVAAALGGLGSGFTFSSLPMLIVPHVPVAETAGALAFNQVLRYIGFAVGSAAAVALLEGFGGDQPAFRATALSLAGVCLLAALAGPLERRLRAVR